MQLWQSLPPEPGVTSFANAGPYVVDDEFGQVYVRRAQLGIVNLYGDGSARIGVPGGTPFMFATQLQLEGDAKPTLHFQREEMVVYPGEVARSSFKREFFNGFCGGCHGSISGREDNVAIKPDILTQASQVEARSKPVQELGTTNTVPQGPPFP